MFIEIERDIIEDAVKNSTKSQLNHSAEILLQFALAIQRGTHVVLIHSIIDPNYKKLFEGLNEIIGERYVNLFRSVIAQRTMWSAISTNIDKKVVITLNTKRTTSSTEIIINPSILSDFHFEQETHLLTENLSDAKFFRHIVLYYKKLCHIKGAPISYYPLNGGGSSLFTVLEHELIKLQHLCLVIADSDKICPKAKVGSTYNNASNICKMYNKFSIGTIYCMKDVAEIENLIPLTILFKHALAASQGINMKGRDLSYYDIKNGLTAKRLYDCKGSIIYWMNIFPEIDFNQVKTLRDKCKSSNEYCEAIDNQKINNLVITCWGGNILNNVEKKNHNELDDINRSDLTDSQHLEWERIGKNIFTWTCALKSRK